MGKSDNLPHAPAARAQTEIALRQAYLPQPWQQRPQDDEEESALTLHDLLQIVLKHKWTLLVVLMLSTVVAGINTFLSRPIYRATAVLQIDSRPQRVVDFNNSGLDVEQMQADEIIALKTQYELLRSRSLAERVIDELQLDRSKASVPPAPGTPGSAPAGPAPLVSEGYIGRIVSGYRKLSTPSSTDQRLLGREGVIGAFLGSLTVDPVQSSRLVRLSVDNADPALAARIANTTAQVFVSLGLERRVESTAYTKTFLEEQIQQMKAKLEESERKLNQYAQQKQILTLDEKTNVLNQTYTEYANALAKAEQERIRL
jgi:uncharacterized protein involved in exopolysaccharide biosynthesis